MKRVNKRREKCRDAKKTRETKKGKRTREQILSTAEELFIESGFDGVSIGDVSSRLRTTKGHVYYYFRSKQDLFDAVMDRYFTAESVALLGAAGRGETPGEKLHLTLDAYLDFIEQNPGYARLIQREICTRSANVEKIAKDFAPIFKWGVSVFGDLLPPEGPLSMQQFFISFFSMVINYYTYAPLLEQLWETNPLSEQSLKDRRQHLHLVLDNMMNTFVEGGKKRRARSGAGRK